MAAQVNDKYSNILYDTVTESAANTLTFEEVNIGLNIFDKVGLLVARIEYYKFMALLADDTDAIEFGLSASNGFAAADPSESSVIDYNRVRIREIGTAATGFQEVEPFVKDFSNLPGGGILVAPKPLYLYVDGANLGSAATVKMRMFFTVVKMKPEDYFELLESRQYFG